MKIQQHGHNLATDRSQGPAPAERNGQGAQNGSRSRQVGLDRIDVSNAAETAARVMQGTVEARAERVTQLRSLVESGEYAVDLPRLSQAILDYDSEPDIAYAG